MSSSFAFPRAGRWARLIVAAVLAVAVIVLLRREFPEPASLVAAWRTAETWWLVPALLAATASQVAFAGQQRSLLLAFGARLRRRDAVALTYSRSALSMVLPAGAVVSAAYAYRHYRRHGATSAAAATVTVLSGAVSVVALALLYAAGALATGLWWASALLALVLAVAVLLFRRASAPTFRFRWARLRRLADGAGEAIDKAHLVRVKSWLITLGFAVANWALDLACLLAVARAFHLTVGWEKIAWAYLTAQLVRQIPVTPGGIGLIEAGLLAGLVTAGSPGSAAVAVVLGYRLLSFWLLLPAGLAGHLVLRAGLSRPERSADDAAPVRGAAVRVDSSV
ncbi:lysylphosphatidylglycerol synthase transmembrane domain-containing protein [Actinoplanes sp. NPDC023936]|uniref:lysylphosphatidylglycerol synthase transmembrane domain-containing protein n=1 Tax=Actinoplanes sp. NPDC023936 TaxID=3154910 RepID=UPI0033D5D95C